jgi:hypothetical protein
MKFINPIYSYFQKILVALSSPPFYPKFVRLPTEDNPVPPHIYCSTKFYLFFKDALAAIDGSHIHCAPLALDRPAYWNRKGFVSQNCLFACSFDLRFVYSLTGWEGSATDAHVYEFAQSEDLYIPDGKYYLADAGFLLCCQLLVPYRGVRYHLAKWGRAGLRCVLYFYMAICILWVSRPQNKQELFNLWHASAQNVVERIFGVLKRRFRILLIPAKYSMRIQARIPSALCALHNFISIHDLTDQTMTDTLHERDATLHRFNEDVAPPEQGTAFVEGNALREKIASEMWDDYQRICEERGLGEDEPLELDEENDTD